MGGGGDTGVGGSDSLGASETAIEETNWLLLKARSKLQQVFGAGATAGVTAGVVEGGENGNDWGGGSKGLRLFGASSSSSSSADERALSASSGRELGEMLREIRRKEPVIKMIIAEQGRLEASVELSELQQQGLKLILGSGSGNHEKALENIEKGKSALLGSLIFDEGEAEGGRDGEGGSDYDEEEEEGGGGGGSRARGGNPLATLLSTVFNPYNISLG